MPKTESSDSTQPLAGRPFSQLDFSGDAVDMAVWAQISRQLEFPTFTNGEGLTQFLALYQENVLQAVEFPAILKAWHLTQHGHARDLIALDQELGKNPCIAAFARASRLIGQRQLRHLRPLKDHRVVQRYLAAVDAGLANGWHPLVFGMTLSIFSLPLRQGLMRHGEECLCGLTAAAATSRRLPQKACRESLDHVFATLPFTIENALSTCSLKVIH